MSAPRRPLRLPALLLAAGLCLGLGSCAGPSPTPRRLLPELGVSLRVLQGNLRFRRGEETAACLRYLQALDDPAAERWRGWITYDLGSLYVSLGELKAGVRRLEEAEAAAPPPDSRAARELAFRRAFNLGVARFEAGAFQEAVYSFIQALREKPDSWDAKHNLELAIRSSLSRPQRGADAAGPQAESRAGEQTPRLLQRLHEQEEPTWMSAPSAEPYAQDW